MGVGLRIIFPRLRRTIGIQDDHKVECVTEIDGTDVQSQHSFPYFNAIME